MQPGYASLCLVIFLGCAEESAGELAAEVHQEEKRVSRFVMDAGLPGHVPGDGLASDAGADRGALDASVEDRCDVLLGIEADGGTGDLALTRSSGERLLRMWAENRSTQAQALRYAAPCHGLPLVGLGSYDPHMRCLRGQCPWPRAPVEIVLAPGERRQLGLGYVDAKRTVCNSGGLAIGTYDVSYVLPELGGRAPARSRCD